MEQTKLQVVLPEEFTNQIYQQMLSIANQAVKQATENIGLSNKKYLNESEVRKYLGIGQDTLNSLLEQNLISYSRIGRQKLYSIVDIENAIESLKF